MLSRLQSFNDWGYNLKFESKTISTPQDNICLKTISKTIIAVRNLFRKLDGVFQKYTIMNEVKSHDNLSSSMRDILICECSYQETKMKSFHIIFKRFPPSRKNKLIKLYESVGLKNI